MGYTLEQLAADIRETLNRNSVPESGGALCSLVSRALADRDFIAAHLTERGPDDDPREVLYEDPELSFCICAHVYNEPAHGEPHDHGSSWAVYGQAEGSTEMTDWSIVGGDDDGAKLVELERTYVLNPGDAHFYDIGAVHAPRRDGPTKLLRIEGANLDHVERSSIKAKEPV